MRMVRFARVTQQFDSAESEALRFYVYSDPRNNQPFYIGKGNGNRAFAHLGDKSESAKVGRIREIREAGHEPQIEILAFGLDGITAFKVEAAAIELYDATRGTWKVSLASAKKAKYALAVFGGTVREVYEIANWLPAGSTMYTDPDRDVGAADRYEFVGRIAPEAVRKLYRWKSVAHLHKPGAANPIMYVGAHGKLAAALARVGAEHVT